MKPQAKGKSPKASPKREPKKGKTAKEFEFCLTLKVFVYKSDGDTAATGEKPQMIFN